MDIRLITLLPSPSAQGVQQPAGSQGNTSGLTNLSGIPSGTVLSGFIINRDSNGNPVLRTESGDITFASAFFLKIGSEVEIRVEQSAGSTLARLLTVDGQPPEVAQTRSSFASTPDVILSQALAARGPLSDLLSSQPFGPASTQSAASSITSSASNAKASITVSGTLILTAAQPTQDALSLPVGTTLALKLVALHAAAGAPPAGTLPTTPGNPASYAAYARATGSAPLAAPSTNAQAQAIPATPGQAPTAAGTPDLPAGAAAATVQSPITASHTPSVQNAGTQSIVNPPSAPAIPDGNSLQLQSGAALPAGESLSVTTQGGLLPAGLAASPTAGGSPIAIALQPISKAGQLLTGTVIGNEPTGEALVQTPLGIVRLQPGSVLPAGSSIRFELLSTRLPEGHMATHAADEPAPFSELVKQWATLEQIFGLLSAKDGASGVDFVQPNMPWLKLDGAPPPQSLVSPQTMSSGMMFFLLALKGGDFKDWLGKHNSQWLEDNGYDGLLKKASGEFMMLARHAGGNSPSQPWQTMLFPVVVEGELQQLRWFLKRDRKKSGNSKQEESEDTRFVIEVELTQLGEIQMDGFVRRQSGQHVHFDLMIRSKAPLPPQVQQDILAIYNATGELTGFHGNIKFQSVNEFPLHPMDEISAKPHNNMMV